MIIAITADEWYPVYALAKEEEDSYKYAHYREVEIDEDMYTEWVDAFDRWTLIQDKIQAVVDKVQAEIVQQEKDARKKSG